MNFFTKATAKIPKHITKGGYKMTNLHEELKHLKHIHFIGIGGVSMSSLAMIAAEQGYSVSGSDTADSDRIHELIRRGITVFLGNSPSNLLKYKDTDHLAVVYTAAANDSNPELSAARQNGILTVSRAEFMGAVMKDIPHRIGIAGMHGKSTVCGMLAHISLSEGSDDSFICGADITCLGGAHKIGKSNRVIFEACEYKNSFLKLEPTVAAVTNIEEEHPDFFRDLDDIRHSFLQYLNGAQLAIIGIDSPVARELVSQVTVPTLTCSIRDRSADYYADNIIFCSGAASFDLFYRGVFVLHASLCVAGEHNLANAVIAAAIALNEDFSANAVASGLSSFTGVKRRMERIGQLKGAVIYDDYAHHPTEIKATLSAARQMGFRFISCAFQPHTYSRTAKFFCDFAHAFGDADEVLFADIYPAREENIYNISSRELAAVTPNGVYVPTAKLIAEHFRKIAAPNILLLIMGAGDIRRVGDILLPHINE